MKNKVKMCICVYLYKFYKDFLFFELSTDDPTRPLYKIYKFTRSPQSPKFSLIFHILRFAVLYITGSL